MTTLGREREDELITDIARQLGLSAAQHSRVHDQCENMRGEFRANFEDEIGATKKRSKLREVERACHQAAKAVTNAPQDWDWLQGRKFTLNGRQFELTRGSTEISMLLWQVSEAAKEAAKSLVLPKSRATPEKDLTALFTWALCTEFLPRQEPSVSPGAAYLSVASLLFEYFTDNTDNSGESLESSCRKVLKQYSSRRRVRHKAG